MLYSSVKLPLALVMWITLVHQKLGCETFRVLKYLHSIFLLYTHPWYMISSKQKCCLLLNGVSTESQKLTSVRQIRRFFFSNKKNDSYTCWTCTELCEAFTFLMETTYVQFDGMVYQQIVGISMGTNCAPLIADLFLYCYERDFMSNLKKSKLFDLIYSPLITVQLLNIFPIYIQEYFSLIKQIHPTKKRQRNAMMAWYTNK